MLQTVFPSIIRSSKLHKQRQVFVRPIVLLDIATYDSYNDLMMTPESRNVSSLSMTIKLVVFH